MKQRWQRQWKFHKIGESYAGLLMVTIGQSFGLGIIYSSYCTSLHLGPLIIDFQWLPLSWREALKKMGNV